MTHTSSLGAVYPGTPLVLDSYRDLDAFMATAPRTSPASAAGTRWSYSNLGYLLLGRIIEIVSGQDYYDYVTENVFRRADMSSTGMEERDLVIRGRAYGYEPNYSVDGLTFRDTSLMIAARAAPFGGAYVTADDLLRFNRALRVLVRPDTWRLISAAKPEIGAPRWGYGFAVDGLPAGAERRSVGHGGNGPGACTRWATLEDTEEPYTLVVLSNAGLESRGPIVDYIFDLLPAHRS